jgi:hypothetical protein
MIAAGMVVGTLFTLFVLPTFYVLLGGKQKIEAPGTSQSAVNVHG